jgi:hypothetical protein
MEMPDEFTVQVTAVFAVFSPMRRCSPERW